MKLTKKKSIRLAKEVRASLPPPLRCAKREIRKVARKARKLLPATFAPVRDFDLEALLLDRKYCEDAQEFLRKTFAAPSRPLPGFVSHTVHFPCVRFGLTLKAESRDYEFAIMLLMAMRTDVIALAEQAQTLPKIILKKGGWTEPTHDLVAITKDGVEILEIGPAAKFAQLRLKGSNIYEMKGDEYVAPDIEEFYAKWGFKFRVVTGEKIDPKFIQAVRPLLAYQTGTPRQAITQEEADIFLGWVAKNVGQRLGDLPMDPTRRVELAHYFIAQCRVFTSLSEIDWEDPEAIRLYLTPQDEAAFHQFLEGSRRRPADLKQLGYYLLPGALIEIGFYDYRVERLTAERVQLRDLRKNELREPLTHRDLLNLKPRIGRIAHAERIFETLFAEASPEDRAEYYRRKTAVAPFLPGGERAGQCPPDRNIRYYRDQWIKLDKSGRCGDEALFPGYCRSGRKPSPWHPEVEARFQELKEKLLKSPRDASVDWLIKDLHRKFDAAILPDDRVIYRRIKNTLDTWDRARRATGKAGALDSQPVFGDSPIHGAPGGGRAFASALVDSTPVDLALPNGHWVSRMVDAFTKKLLADIQYEGHPSAVTERALILECVEKYGALPAILSFDKGAENRTTWMQKSLSAFSVAIEYRPTRDPRKGSGVENSFAKELAELTGNLPANTKNLAQFNFIAKHLRPENFAVLTADDLRQIREAYVQITNAEPRKNGEPSPDALEAASFKKFGLPPCQVPEVEAFKEVLLPFVPGQGGKRKISTRGTIRCLHKKWSVIGENNPLRKFAGKSFDVRYKPEDLSAVMVYPDSPLKGIRCVCISRRGPSSDLLDSGHAFDAKRLAADGPLPSIQGIAERVLDEAAKRRRRTRKGPATPAAPAMAAVAETSDEEIPIYAF
jgi:hypothetical protein